MGNCTYTFGISILTPKPHDKLAYFRDGLSSGTLAKLINYPFVALRDLRPPLYKILLPSKPFEQPLKISFALKSLSNGIARLGMLCEALSRENDHVAIGARNRLVFFSLR